MKTNEDYCKDMLIGIFKRLNQLPMKRSTDWIMEIIKERVELNIDIFKNAELTIKLCGKNIADLERLPEARRNSDFGVSLLREKFGSIIHLMGNPDNEYQKGGGGDKFAKTKKEIEDLARGEQQSNNGEGD